LDPGATWRRGVFIGVSPRLRHATQVIPQWP
jgi:hypothetical protein